MSDGSPNWYLTLSKWVDHIRYNHDVHFVISAGNRHSQSGEGIVGAAMGYNVITVGNTTLNNEINSGSLYNADGGEPLPIGTFKPDRSCTINPANLKVEEFTVVNYGYGAGTYKIEVKQVTPSSYGSTNFGLAWR